MAHRFELTEEAKKKLSYQAANSIKTPKTTAIKKISEQSRPKFKMPKKNLNEHKKLDTFIRCGGETVRNYEKPRVRSLNVASVESVIDDIPATLCDKIKEFATNRIVIGAIAWVSDKEIIEALSLARRVLILVNDEDYSTWGGGVVTREKYKPLKAFGENPPLSHYWKGVLDTPLNLKSLENNHWEAVRTFGYSCVVEQEGEEFGLSKEEIKSCVKKPTMMKSLMHCKDIVICDDNNLPRWVWIGSMNFTQNSRNNIEHGIFIDNRTIATNTFHRIVNMFLKSGEVRY
jgi:hypothetical protein